MLSVVFGDVARATPVPLVAIAPRLVHEEYVEPTPGEVMRET